MLSLKPSEDAACASLISRRSAGQLPADKKGRDYFIDLKDLAPLKHRKPGRLRKKRKS
jgi:hypothetical protein